MKKSDYKSGISSNGVDIVQVRFGGKVAIGGFVYDKTAVLTMSQLKKGTKVGMELDEQYPAEDPSVPKVELVFKNERSIDVMVDTLKETRKMLIQEKYGSYWGYFLHKVKVKFNIKDYKKYVSANKN